MNTKIIQHKLAMFSTYEYLRKKTGPYGTGRFNYLQSLVTEFQESTNQEAKEQVLANLANFAYDPINYQYFRTLNVLDLFLDCLTEENANLVELAVAGLCNVCLDKENKEFILSHNGVKLVIDCLTQDRENTILSTITTLMYLVTPGSKAEITQDAVVDAMIQLAESPNKRIGNLATVFLEDYCDQNKVQKLREAQRQEIN